MITIGNETFQVEHIQEVHDLACQYLTLRPEHSHGFCFWATQCEPVYSIIGGVRAVWAGSYDIPAYVDTESGPTAARLLFVRQLRDYLSGRLYFHKDTTRLYSSMTHAGRQLPKLPSPAPTEPTRKTARAVLVALRQGETTLRGIALVAGCSEAGASARIRELRSEWNWPIESRRHKNGNGRQFWTYHLAQ